MTSYNIYISRHAYYYNILIADITIQHNCKIYVVYN